MSPFILHITLITLLDLAGTVCAKLYNIHKSSPLLIATFLFFGAAGYVFAKSVQYEGIAITNAVWIALSVIAVTIVGYFIFKEEIAPIQFVGIGVIMFGLLLINLK